MSPRGAWAVGEYFTTQETPFAVRWNGAAWRQVPTEPLRPLGYNSILLGVAAVSGHHVWAVGTDLDAVAEHWNGSAWEILDSGLPGTYTDVAADRTGDVWAVGNYFGQSALVVRLR
jgi:hypothetical protein